MENLTFEEILEIPGKELKKMSTIIEMGAKKINKEFEENKYAIDSNRLAKWILITSLYICEMHQSPKEKLKDISDLANVMNKWSWWCFAINPTKFKEINQLAVERINQGRENYRNRTLQEKKKQGLI